MRKGISSVRCAPGLLVLFVLCASSLQGAAEEVSLGGPIELAKIKILDSPFHEFRVGEQFILNLDHEQLERSGGAKGVRFRIFSGLKEDIINHRGIPTKDSCLLFISKSYDARAANGGVHFDFSFSLNWLAFDQYGNLSDAYYLLVIEKVNDTSDFLRLNESDLHLYFNRGFPFVVKGPSRPVTVGVAPTLLEKRRRASEANRRARALAAQGQNSKICKRFVHVFDPEEMAFKPHLLACRAEPSSRRHNSSANQMQERSRSTRRSA